MIGGADVPLAPALAAVFLSPAIGVPIGIALAIPLVVVWRLLGREGVPPARRSLRRSATVTMGVGLVCGVLGTSFIDAATQPGAFLAVWAAVMLVVLVLLAFAVIDMLLSTWLIRLEREGEAIRAGAAVLAELERRREAGLDEIGDGDPEGEIDAADDDGDRSPERRS